MEEKELLNYLADRQIKMRKYMNRAQADNDEISASYYNGAVNEIFGLIKVIMNKEYEKGIENYNEALKIVMKEED